MTNDLVKRMRVRDCGSQTCGDERTEAADRIEELEKQLSLINNSLEVTITEEITKNWVEFCEALVAETREILGERQNDT